MSLLDRLVSILPESQRDKAKAYVAWLGTVASIVTLVVPVAPRWLTAVVAVLTALGVYATPAPGYQTEGYWGGVSAPVDRADIEEI